MINLDTWASWAQICSLPIAIIAILVSFWFYWRGRQKRSLSCEFSPIIHPIEIKAGEALGGDIEILYKGKPVENLLLQRVKLRNSGSLPIRKSHVIDPITFTFEPDSKLLRQPELLERKPADLKANWESANSDSDSGGDAVVLEFDLLNPGDELVVEFTCTGARVVPNITTRIEGVAEIKQIDAEERILRDKIAYRLRSIFSLSLVAAVGLLLIWVVNSYFYDWGLNKPAVLPQWASYMLWGGSIIFVLVLPIFEPIMQLIQYRRRRLDS